MRIVGRLLALSLLSLISTLPFFVVQKGVLRWGLEGGAGAGGQG